MLIAKLRISLTDVAIRYNKKEELGIEAGRGTVLQDGKIVRGLGTHFENQAAKERFDMLTSESNKIREKFSRRFLRSPLEGVFVINHRGEAREFVKGIPHDSGLDVSVTEFELGGLGNGLDEEEMRDWAEKVKTQLGRIPLGRAKNASVDGISALEELAKCPVLSAQTKEAVATLVTQAKANQIDRPELMRSLEILDVQMDQGILSPERHVEIAQ